MSHPAPAPPALGPAHERRLRAVWRSAGWPYQDALEAELLAAGWLERQRDAAGRETVRVSDAGVAALAAAQRRHRGARSAHEALVERVARELQRAGRLVWRGLALRAPLAGDDGTTRWVQAVPDLFSIRHTTLEARLAPAVHEIKVRRADLLADLRRPDKRAAYLAMAGECWYVLAEGIGDADDVPPPCGVLRAGASGLEALRPPACRGVPLPLATWMALARSGAEPPLDDGVQRELGADEADAF